MIEFRKDAGTWTCTGDDDCYEPAAAIVTDGWWYFSAACDNEKHIAAALAEDAELINDRGEENINFMRWADAVEHNIQRETR